MLAWSSRGEERRSHTQCISAEWVAEADQWQWQWQWQNCCLWLEFSGSFVIHGEPRRSIWIRASVYSAQIHHCHCHCQWTIQNKTFWFRKRSDCSLCEGKPWQGTHKRVEKWAKEEAFPEVEIEHRSMIDWPEATADYPGTDEEKAENRDKVRSSSLWTVTSLSGYRRHRSHFPTTCVSKYGISSFNLSAVQPRFWISCKVVAVLRICDSADRPKTRRRLLPGTSQKIVGSDINTGGKGEQSLNCKVSCRPCWHARISYTDRFSTCDQSDHAYSAAQVPGRGWEPWTECVNVSQ